MTLYLYHSILIHDASIAAVNASKTLPNLIPLNTSGNDYDQNGKCKDFEKMLSLECK